MPKLRREGATHKESRTGHGPFVSYLKRFGKEGTPKHNCDVPQEPQHLSYCQELAAHRSLVREACERGKRRNALGTKGLYEAMVGNRRYGSSPSRGQVWTTCPTGVR